MADDAPLVVPDARADARLCDSPAIDDLPVAACAGYPLHSPDGEVLGAFCVIDTTPPAVDAAETRDRAGAGHRRPTRRSRCARPTGTCC